MVVAPLLPALPAGARVTVAPDGALHGVPLGALVVPASEGQPARYWIQNVTLTVTPSLLTLPKRAPEGGVGPAGAAGLVGIGDAPESGVEFPRLPSAGDELTALERHFPGHNRLIGRGAEARPELNRTQLGTAALIHFATHALANPMPAAGFDDRAGAGERRQPVVGARLGANGPVAGPVGDHLGLPERGGTAIPQRGAGGTGLGVSQCGGPARGGRVVGCAGPVDGGADGADARRAGPGRAAGRGAAGGAVVAGAAAGGLGERRFTGRPFRSTPGLDRRW